MFWGSWDLFWFIGANLGIIFFIEKILFWKDFLSGFGSGIYGGREASAPLAARFDNERKNPGKREGFPGLWRRLRAAVGGEG